MEGGNSTLVQVKKSCSQKKRSMGCVTPSMRMTKCSSSGVVQLFPLPLSPLFGLIGFVRPLSSLLISCVEVATPEIDVFGPTCLPSAVCHVQMFWLVSEYTSTNTSFVMLQGCFNPGPGSALFQL